MSGGRFWAAIAAGTTSEAAAVDAGVSRGGRNTMVQEGRRHAAIDVSVSRRSRSQVGISHLRSERRSRSFASRRTPCRRSLAGSGGRPRRSRESCGAMLPPEAAAWSIVRRPRNGTPSARLAVQSRRSLRATRHCEPTSTNGWLASSSLTNGCKWPGPVISWKSRRHGSRKDRRWATAWSPEQIAHRLPRDFPDDSDHAHEP